jgi:hypothetical protein
MEGKRRLVRLSDTILIEKSGMMILLPMAIAVVDDGVNGHVPCRSRYPGSSEAGSISQLRMERNFRRRCRVVRIQDFCLRIGK